MTTTTSSPFAPLNEEVLRGIVHLLDLATNPTSATDHQGIKRSLEEYTKRVDFLRYLVVVFVHGAERNVAVSSRVLAGILLKNRIRGVGIDAGGGKHDFEPLDAHTVALIYDGLPPSLNDVVMDIRRTASHVLSQLIIQVYSHCEGDLVVTSRRQFNHVHSSTPTAPLAATSTAAATSSPPASLIINQKTLSLFFMRLAECVRNYRTNPLLADGAFRLMLALSEDAGDVLESVGALSAWIPLWIDFMTIDVREKDEMGSGESSRQTATMRRVSKVSPSKLREYALDCLACFLPTMPPALAANSSAYLTNLARLANGSPPGGGGEVKVKVLSGLSLLLEFHPTAVLPHLTSVLEFVLTAMSPEEKDELVAREACDFLNVLCIHVDAAEEVLLPRVARVLEYLVGRMTYTPADLEELRDELGNDALIPDRLENVRPHRFNAISTNARRKFQQIMAHNHRLDDRHHYSHGGDPSELHPITTASSVSSLSVGAGTRPDVGNEMMSRDLNLTASITSSSSSSSGTSTPTTLYDSQDVNASVSASGRGGRGARDGVRGLDEESEDEDEEGVEGEEAEGEEDDEGTWTLRRCAGLALDNVSKTVDASALLEGLLPVLRSRLASPEWEHREVAILALGAVAQGRCGEELHARHASELLPFLLRHVAEGENVLVRRVALWATARFAERIGATEDPSLFFAAGGLILERFGDPNKGVQCAAISALASMLEYAPPALAEARAASSLPVLEFARRILAAFGHGLERFQVNNLAVLYDTVAVALDSSIATALGIVAEEAPSLFVPALMSRFLSLQFADPSFPGASWAVCKAFSSLGRIATRAHAPRVLNKATDLFAEASSIVVTAAEMDEPLSGGDFGEATYALEVAAHILEAYGDAFFSEACEGDSARVLRLLDLTATACLALSRSPASLEMRESALGVVGWICTIHASSRRRHAIDPHGWVLPPPHVEQLFSVLYRVVSETQVHAQLFATSPRAGREEDEYEAAARFFMDEEGEERGSEGEEGEGGVLRNALWALGELCESGSPPASLRPQLLATLCALLTYDDDWTGSLDGGGGRQALERETGGGGEEAAQRQLTRRKQIQDVKDNVVVVFSRVVTRGAGEEGDSFLGREVDPWFLPRFSGESSRLFNALTLFFDCMDDAEPEFAQVKAEVFAAWVVVWSRLVEGLPLVDSRRALSALMSYMAASETQGRPYQSQLPLGGSLALHPPPVQPLLRRLFVRYPALHAELNVAGRSFLDKLMAGRM